MWLVALLLVAAAITVGVVAGWQFVAAPALGLLVLLWGTASLRSMRDAVGRPPGVEVSPVVEGRTVFWCEECGAEFEVRRPGDGTPPRHCGTRMRPRVEL